MTITFHAGRRIQGLSTDIVETPTFEDDFSSDNWTDKDSTNIGVSGGILTGENVLDGGDDTSYYDLTSTSDTNWILRFKGTYTTTYGTGNASKILYVGLSSDTNAQNTAKDFAGFIFEQWNLPQFKISGGVVNNTTLEYASSLSNLNALNTSSATTVTNYFEIKRDNDNFTFTVYSNSDYTGQLATVTRTVSSVTTLRYLVLTNRDISASNTGSLTVSVDDLTFYNGVSSLTSKPTDVQSGSRFEETDTRKIYYWDNVFATTEEIYEEIAGESQVSYWIVKESPNHSNGEGRYVGIQIQNNAGGQALVGKYIRKIKAYLGKTGTLSGNYTVGVMASDGTVKAYVDTPASNIGSSWATYEHTMNYAVSLEVGDVIFIKYIGSNSILLASNTVTNGWNNNYSGAFSPRSITSGDTNWVTIISGDANRLWMMAFDSTPASNQPTETVWTEES